MKLAIITTEYPPFLDWFYAKSGDLKERSYAEQIRRLEEELFAECNFYAVGLRKLGHQAEDFHANNENLQRAWAADHAFSLGRSEREWVLRRGWLPWLRRKPGDRWLQDILLEQVARMKPDVIFNHDLHYFDAPFLRKLKRLGGMLVGQIASRPPLDERLREYDLVLSSLPNLVARLRAYGVCTEPFKLGFGGSVAALVPEVARDIPVSFVGSLGASHSSRIEFLRFIAERTDLRIWGMGAESLSADDPLKRCHMGPAWGRGMYTVLRRSRITLNHHLDYAGPYANNMRLYESTGMGTCLLTDWKENLSELFVPEREVATYRSPGECVEKIRSLLQDEGARISIARAGERRTMTDHTYDLRMGELISLLRPAQPRLASSLG